jgi:hypothetical protein
MDMERFNLKEFNEEVKEQYKVTIKNKFSALENKRVMGTSIGHGALLERT